MTFRHNNSTWMLIVYNWYGNIKIHVVDHYATIWSVESYSVLQKDADVQLLTFLLHSDWQAWGNLLLVYEELTGSQDSNPDLLLKQGPTGAEITGGLFHPGWPTVSLWVFSSGGIITELRSSWGKLRPFSQSSDKLGLKITHTSINLYSVKRYYFKSLCIQHSFFFQWVLTWSLIDKLECFLKHYREVLLSSWGFQWRQHEISQKRCKAGYSVTEKMTLPCLESST